VTELAERVEVSAGMSVKTLRTLEADLYVRRDRRRRVRVADGESLLLRWAAVSGLAFRDAGRFTSPVPDPDELAIRLAGNAPGHAGTTDEDILLDPMAFSIRGRGS